MATSFAVNGVQVYALSAGKSLPQWLSERTRRALNKDPDFRRRIELIQDFSFPSASQTVTLSGSGRYIVATGTYPPRVRVFDTAELSMKFERYMDGTPVASVALADDYSKLAFLQDDRNVEVHAAYGRHYRTRIPTFGRDMAFHQPTAELLVAASGPEVYRLSLEEGRFMSPLACVAAGVNKVAVSRLTALIGTAGEGGLLELWDPRDTRAAAATLRVQSDAPGCGPVDLTALDFSERALAVAVGTADGRAIVYDLRRAPPLVVKDHQYGLPVHTVRFHRSGGEGSGGGVGAGGSGPVVISADARIVKLWRQEGGATFANIEPPCRVNAVTVASDAPGVGGSSDSGLLLVAGETERVQAFYVPQLGLAPAWCGFLDALTEELEEGGARGGSGAAAAPPAAVYDDYRFVTREELGALSLAHLVGTPLLRPYLHGFFMDARLHARLQAVADPFAYDRWRRERVAAAVDAKRSSRIVPRDAAGPKVNRALAARLQAAADASAADASAALERGGARGRTRRPAAPAGDAAAGLAAAAAPTAASASSAPAAAAAPAPPPATAAARGAALLRDGRVAALFTNPDFAIDEESAEFITVHPHSGAAGGAAAGAAKAATAAAGRGAPKRRRVAPEAVDSDDGGE